MGRSKNKIFKDIVHGYITIPEDYCIYIIDTEIFQRLRRIEQTSIRSLYPSAHHERFVHSLGTYYLGDKIFNNIIENIEIHQDEEMGKALSHSDWELLGNTYRLACLLHDCGHAPFSHTLEHYYELYNDLNGILEELTQEDESFMRDCVGQFSGSPHEKVSAILVLKYFKDILDNKLQANAFLAARMIIGCQISNPKNNFEKISNCFIQLLNGGIIDADRLDYAKRDVMSSGYSTVNIDFDRLLSAICIKKDKFAHKDDFDGEYKVCFHKGAILDIPRILEIKDFQSSWVFCHHKTIYDQHILIEAINTLVNIIAKISGTDKDVIFRELFNLNSFYNVSPLGKYDSIYLLSDGDIMYLMKKYIHGNKFAQEWFSRCHRLKPLWKSHAELRSLFHDVPISKLDKNGKLEKKAEELLKGYFKETLGDNTIPILKKEAKNVLSAIDTNYVYIYINEKVVKFEDIIEIEPSTSKDYFYLYVPRDLIPDNKSKIGIIKHIKKGII